MYCKNCGATVPENAEVCPECNSRQLGGKNVPKNTTYYTHSTTYSAPLDDPMSYKMGWYKFMIWGPLLIFNIFGIIGNIMTMTGAYYFGYADEIYAAFPVLQFFDVLSGGCGIVLGIFVFYTRHRLVNFCKNGPSLLIASYILSAVINFVYTVGTISVLPNTLTDMSSYSTNLISIVVTIVYICVNKIYFDNRKALFVN